MATQKAALSATVVKGLTTDLNLVAGDHRFQAQGGTAYIAKDSAAPDLTGDPAAHVIPDRGSETMTQKDGGENIYAWGNCLLVITSIAS